jgi:hypothetical protein
MPPGMLRKTPTNASSGHAPRGPRPEAGGSFRSACASPTSVTPSRSWVSVKSNQRAYPSRGPSRGPQAADRRRSVRHARRATRTERADGGAGSRGPAEGISSAQDGPFGPSPFLVQQSLHIIHESHRGHTCSHAINRRSVTRLLPPDHGLRMSWACSGSASHAQRAASRFETFSPFARSGARGAW